jgi:hypothetical protein
MKTAFITQVGRTVRAGALLLVVALSGCASTLSARVTSFQQWPANAQGQTYRFVQADPVQANNLEYRAYQDMVRAGIGATGLVEATGGAPARFEVAFDYGAVQTTVMTRQPYDPYFYGGGFYGPRWGYGRYGGGFWGPEWVDVPAVAYRNFVNLHIRDHAANNAEVYRSSAATHSDRAELVNVMPYLVRAIFDNFPGNNGSDRVIKYRTSP